MDRTIPRKRQSKNKQTIQYDRLRKFHLSLHLFIRTMIDLRCSMLRDTLTIVLQPGRVTFSLKELQKHDACLHLLAVYTELDLGLVFVLTKRDGSRAEMSAVLLTAPQK
ncbi:hypothetical protein RRG08_036896 [Elysia crispata]|uniref:Uncharacterized protein n=1 Tax=Elysia crispata TaxID=231223 RepID=A0AAE0Z7B0_9GAST|nr:hypothetical protein RRG08_051497 [Elysia crispata]KAK3766259.1 hypothetical protein RRG08_036896 [Elysia crispata]